nr:MAG TPA: hypothetical protein [Caudoviricetes sp.]
MLFLFSNLLINYIWQIQDTQNFKALSEKKSMLLQIAQAVGLQAKHKEHIERQTLNM